MHLVISIPEEAIIDASNILSALVLDSNTRNPSQPKAIGAFDQFGGIELSIALTNRKSLRFLYYSTKLLSVSKRIVSPTLKTISPIFPRIRSPSLYRDKKTAL